MCGLAEEKSWALYDPEMCRGSESGQRRRRWRGAFLAAGSVTRARAAVQAWSEGERLQQGAGPATFTALVGRCPDERLEQCVGWEQAEPGVGESPALS